MSQFIDQEFIGKASIKRDNKEMMREIIPDVDIVEGLLLTTSITVLAGGTFIPALGLSVCFLVLDQSQYRFQFVFTIGIIIVKIVELFFIMPPTNFSLGHISTSKLQLS